MIWKETDVWKEAISFIEMVGSLASQICNKIFLKQGNFRRKDISGSGRS